MWQVPHGRASHFLARARAHMPPARVPPPTPSPDGLCQASSAASLTPQQLLGQGCARTQLARVPPSLGAAGMLRGTGGWVGWSFHGDLILLYMCGVRLPGAQRTGSWRRGAQDRRVPLWPHTKFTSWLTQSLPCAHRPLIQYLEQQRPW